ncbi:MAG: polysaccharide biosynthesis tyrosine autokinase [Chloroflexi bacterium]|nr:polysaccharide biosynthesis tyrosine autokinase [Chloroflexota bacterium]MCC6895135.1 polysaccharide biosynthesis tyrosine autokinase [Anaerolineae bacterium]
MNSTTSPFTIVLRLLVKWWWLIAIAVAIGGGVGYFVRSKQPNIYVAKATVILGQFFQSTAQVQAFEVIRQQITTYGDLVREAKVLQPVIDRLQLPISVEDFNKRIEVSEEPNLPLLNISVSDTSADNAVNIANAIVQELIDNGPGGQLTQEQQFLANQLRQLQAQITQLQSEYDDLIATGATLTSAFEIAQNETRMQSTLTTLQNVRTLYATMSASMANTGNQLSVFSSASVKNVAVVTGSFASVILAAAGGLILSILTIILIAYFDDRLVWQDNLEQIDGVRVIGPLGMIPRNKLPLYVSNMPGTIEAEVLRQLRAKLVLATDGAQPKVVTITSYDSGDGKSVTSSNLALVTAEAGLRTLLVDGDIRKGNLHEFFGLPNVMGLSDILAGRDDLSVLLSRALLDTNVENLTLLTAGRASSNPAVLLSKPRLGDLIKLLRDQFDAIVMDSVPSIGGPDSAFLAEHSDGVVIVVHGQRTTRRSLRRTLQTLQQGANRAVNIYGIVFNRVSLQLTSTYSRPYYRRDFAINPDKLNQEMLTAGKRPGLAGRNNNIMVDPNGIRLYSLPAASVQLGISKDTLQSWIQKGSIKVEKRNRRDWISETEISELLERLPRHELPAESGASTPIVRKNATGKLSSGKLRDLLGGQRDALLASARDPNAADEATE